MWHFREVGFSPHGLIATLVTAVALVGLMSVAHAGPLSYTNQHAQPQEVGSPLGDITLQTQTAIKETVIVIEHMPTVSGGAIPSANKKLWPASCLLVADDTWAKSLRVDAGPDHTNAPQLPEIGGMTMNGAATSGMTFGDLEPPANSAWSAVLVHTEARLIPSNGGVSKELASRSGEMDGIGKTSEDIGDGSSNVFG